ncbi:MAG: hypothetical protein G01um101430_599 [Parcubacteria group bacterium Gr01-1014_30]|nr:MAG: hypothetical protein G01um101430_599 [Parcubacteria group bacterium Gr01-1014_30]
MNVKFFDSKTERFIKMLDAQTVARTLRTIDLLEMFGHKLGFPHSKKVEPRIFELRVRGKQEVRIFYTFHDGEAILLHGFIKKSQRLPRKEIEAARRTLKVLDSS